MKFNQVKKGFTENLKYKPQYNSGTNCDIKLVINWQSGSRKRLQ